MKIYKSETFYFDITMLLMCAGALILSFLFQVRGDLRVYIPVSGGIKPPETCLFRMMIGHNCPTCGLTRSFVSLSHFDIGGAWFYNKAGILVYLLCVVQVPYRILRLAFKDFKYPTHGIYKTISYGFFSVLGVMLLINWITAW